MWGCFLATENQELLGIYVHLFPGFTENHVKIYRYLWCIEPKGNDEIIRDTGLARATVFKILAELLGKGLISKNKSRPIAYYSGNPLEAYSLFSQRVITRLKKGREKLGSIMGKPWGVDTELYFVKWENGEQKLVSKSTRQALLDEEKLMELRKAIDTQLEAAGVQKLRAWEAWR